MTDADARSTSLAIDVWHDLTQRVINDMLQADEDVSDRVLYKRRLAETVAAVRRKFVEAGQ